MFSDTFILHYRLVSDTVAWGRVSSLYLSAQWWCCYLVVRSSETSSPQSTEDCVPYMQKCLDSLDLVAEAGVVPILNCIAVLLGKVRVDLFEK